MTVPPLLQVRDLSVRYPVDGGLFEKRRYLHAVQGVRFDLAPGETLGIVGESGCGKSTLGRAVLGLIEPFSGCILWDGKDLSQAGGAERRQFRRAMTIIFQDPQASLNPRMNVASIVQEPLDIFEPTLADTEKRRLVHEVLQRVGLPPDSVDRYPHQFSGGQCQRIGIARAVILKPRMIVCDEAVSALDVSVQAQIIALLERLRREEGVALLFISHNLAVVREISDRVMVLYLGKVMEIADRDSLYRSPRHPYTQALLSAVPIPDPEIERHRTRVPLIGELPSPLNPPSGCVFRTRCPLAFERCATEVPVLRSVGPTHAVACHLIDVFPDSSALDSREHG